MSKKRGLLLDRAFSLLIVVAVLQAVAVGLLLRFGGDILHKNRSIEQHTSAMLNEIFPAMRSDLVDVAQKTTDIKHHMVGLRGQVSKVDERLGEVNEGVNAVSAQVDGLNRNVEGFVQDKSGLIWGHSVNPFVLLGLLALIAVSVPWWGWYFFRKRPAALNFRESPHEGRDFSDKLDNLTRIMERIREEERRFSSNSELWSLMKKTERLIDEARTELAHIPENASNSRNEAGGRENLH
jgi:hypothetical protein